ncbi:MAG TPA: hypothetical protein VNN07_12975 [Candidatus Tectomicrobia bacterium]|nr:hypothetical protein [Candidatus Tectomicrobia bacterium]
MQRRHPLVRKVVLLVFIAFAIVPTLAVAPPTARAPEPARLSLVGVTAAVAAFAIRWLRGD